MVRTSKSRQPALPAGRQRDDDEEQSGSTQTAELHKTQEQLDQEIAAAERHNEALKKLAGLQQEQRNLIASLQPALSFAGAIPSIEHSASPSPSPQWKPNKPEIFKGKTRREADRFLQVVETAFEQIGAPTVDSQRITWVKQFLDPDTYLLTWKTHVQQHPEDANDWDEFTNWLRNQTAAPEVHEGAVYQKLENARQKEGHSPVSFHQYLAALEAQIPKIASEDPVSLGRRYFYKLLPSLQNAMRARGITSWKREAIVQEAIRQWDLLSPEQRNASNSRKRQHSPDPPTSRNTRQRGKNKEDKHKDDKKKGDRQNLSGAQTQGKKCPVCSFWGHTGEECYRVIGYPSDWKGKRYDKEGNLLSSGKD